MSTSGDEERLEPEVWSLLESSLQVYQDEHEELFADPETQDEIQLHQAMNALRTQAFDLLTTGRLPSDLADQLAQFQPGTSTERKVLELLQYNLVQHRIEFDVAWDVVGRLRHVNRRVRVATLAFALLLRSEPSETAIKYFRTACSLFLAGYQSEVAVMCGAVLEAALGTRLDDAMRTAGVRPQFQRTNDYSTKQRMDFEAIDPFFTVEQREMFWEVVRWRNDAVHVQPDLAPPPERPLVFTASLLPLILPRAVPL